MHRPFTLLLLALLLACGPTPGDSDGGADAGAADAGTFDAGEEDGGLPAVRRLGSVAPAAGPVTGGTAVELRGEGLVPGMEFRFGEHPCTELSVPSGTRGACYTPVGPAAILVDVVARWPDGFEATLPGAFAYQDRPGPTLGWWSVVEPATDPTVEAGAEVAVQGAVYAEGVTPGAGQGEGITAEAGLGPEGSDPAAAPEAFAWTALGYQGDADGPGAGDQANDLYGGTLTAPASPGRSRLALRFREDGGAWRYADRSGSDDGFSPDALPVVTVRGEPTIDWCHLQWPASTVGVPGLPTREVIYGQVLVAGVTGGAGQGSGVLAQVGIGADGSDPGAGGWTWTDADYNADVGENDEYRAQPASPGALGPYDYAFRFSVDAGATWTYCDLEASGGSGDGYQPAGAGALTVETVSVDYCNLQWPAAMTLAPGATSEAVYGQVWSEGLTEADGPAYGLLAQLGLGADGSDPAGAGWTWIDAVFNTQAENNDEYQATLVAPAAAGTYDYLYRFSGDGGATWTYCDLGGSAGDLTVE